MRSFAPLLLLFTALSFGQTQNRPDLTAPLLQILKAEAQARGVDISERLAELDTLKVGDPNEGYPYGYARSSYEWAGDVEKITLSPEIFKPESNEALFLFLHEIGHHFGILDCYKCRYNISAGNYSERAIFLSKDSQIKDHLLNLFFNQLAAPNAPHLHF